MFLHHFTVWLIAADFLHEWLSSPICAFVAVIDGMVSFQAGIVFFQVVQTLAEYVAVEAQWTEETI